MNRRQLIKGAAALPTLSSPLSAIAGTGSVAHPGGTYSRVRPRDPGWPSGALWERLHRAVGGRLIEVRSPLDRCVATPTDPACALLFDRLRNPYYLRDDAALTQSLGWVGAWTSRPSAYAVAVATSADVAAAVNFAREHNLRLVVKGAGHSYQGTSNGPDSLLVWTRPMDEVSVHDAFAPADCAGRLEPRPAVSVGAGAVWGQVYHTVTTGAGRYVQGGGCLTVGAAGLVLSGGFGSFSKTFGTAAASLLEAEIVTADGVVRTVNACRNADLFWALKGGGGGSFGIVTRLTLATHHLPETFGAVMLTVKAASDAAFQRLIARVLGFYADALHGPYWGEQIAFRPGNVLSVSMLFQGLSQDRARTLWAPFLAWLSSAPQDYALDAKPWIVAVPARRFWDPAFLETIPGLVLRDDRPGAPPENVYYAGNRDEAGQVMHGYQSVWLPAELLGEGGRERFSEALFAASRHWSVSLHFNKGLAGAPADVVAAARDTATNPAVLDAVALAISGAEGPPAYPGIAGREPDFAAARHDAAAVDRAMRPLRALVPKVGSYLAESNFFEEDWQTAFWGRNYSRLLAVKDRYDPGGLFVTHHGVGSERWSADGFTRLR